MKINNIIALTFLIVILSAVSCSDEFLEIAPTGSLSSTELSSEAGLEGSLIASYSMLLGRSGFYSDSSNWMWGSVRGGEANKGTNAGDQSQVNEVQAHASQTTNTSILEKYRAVYEGVARANATLGLIQTADAGVSDDTKNRITGEARFLRGHYYFELKKNWNNTPYVDESWDEVTPVSNTADLWPFIEADLKFAYDNLPGTMPDAGRANKWAAGAYYGKALLFQGKYSEARTVLADVVANGTTANGQPYALNANYADAFRSPNDNSAESVFAVQAAAGTGDVNNANAGLVLNFPNGPGAPGGCCGFFQPSFELANSFRTSNGLPLLDGSYNDAGNALVTDMGIESADPFDVDSDPVDTRLDHSIGRRGIPYLDWGPHPGKLWIRDQPYAGPYAPKKFIYYQGGNGTENDLSSWTPGYTAVNYNIIRYSDVLLMLAEAEVEAGDLGTAAELVDEVRQRAANSTIAGSPANYDVALYGSFGSQEMGRNAVRMERKLELSGEGHRMYDLVRWGIAAPFINAYLAYEGPQLNAPYAGASFDAGQDEYLPIPQSEIDLIGSDVLIQNPGY